MKKEFIIGIDVSKDKLDACLMLTGNSKPFEEKVIKNRQIEITKFFQRLIKKYKTENLLVCFEHTGYYGLQLCIVLENLGLDYTIVPALEIKQSQGMTRGKTDQVDARRIATYAWRYADKLKLTKLPSKELLMIKELEAARELLVKMRSQLKNSIKQHELLGEYINNELVVTTVNEQIKKFDADIEKIELKIIDIIKQNKEIEESFNLITSIKGIGQITAVVIIITTNNFNSITDGRKYSSYAGLAPFAIESGTMNKGSKVSNLANKKIKALLHNGACSAINHDNELKYYYNRKVNEGKAKLSVINAVACKLIYRVFAVIKRQTPYVNLYQNRVA